ncbi:TetR/AcrR family transcriptional regulator [Nocardia sp. NPDC050710]|uniref:TetR/AcrR family transcriptional regulator n=1 Tax=Nocardia sp. NPDC050710 TaxID=3157220 RepID=UPI0033D2E9C9
MTKQFSSVWTREMRQPKTSGLRRDQIVTAAVEILDAEGLSALSMRKLGAKLDSGATSLYWYVANKGELLELALDEFWGMLDGADPGEASWREVVTTFAYSFRETLLAHPWAATLIGQLPSMGPNSLRLTDRLRRAFVQAGFTGTDIYLSSGTVMCFVLGQVMPELAWSNAYGDAEPDRDALIEDVLELAHEYPEMVEEYRATPPMSVATARALAFDYGLLCVLDGLAARLRHPRESSGVPDESAKMQP